MLSTIRKVTSTADDGASAVEYGLLVAASAALVIIIVFAVGGLFQDVFSDSCTKVGTGSTSACSTSC